MTQLEPFTKHLADRGSNDPFAGLRELSVSAAHGIKQEDTPKKPAATWQPKLKRSMPPKRLTARKLPLTLSDVAQIAFLSFAMVVGLMLIFTALTGTNAVASAIPTSTPYPTLAATSTPVPTPTITPTPVPPEGVARGLAEIWTPDGQSPDLNFSCIDCGEPDALPDRQEYYICWTGTALVKDELKYIPGTEPWKGSPSFKDARFPRCIKGVWSIVYKGAALGMSTDAAYALGIDPLEFALVEIWVYKDNIPQDFSFAQVVMK